MTATLRAHWPEYLIEAAGLGAFMVSACAFGVLLFHPGSAACAALGTDLARRVVMGLAIARRGCAKLDHPPDRPCIFCGQGRVKQSHPATGQLRVARSQERSMAIHAGLSNVAAETEP